MAIIGLITDALGRTVSQAAVASSVTSSPSLVSSTSTSAAPTSSAAPTTTSVSSATPSTTSAAPSTTSTPAAPTTTTQTTPTTSSAATSSARSSASLTASSTLTSSAAASASATQAESSGLGTLGKSLIIAAIVVASTIALIVAVGFLLRRRRDGRRDRRDRTHELDGYGKDNGASSPQMEKDQPGVGDDRFVQALGRGERPSGRAMGGGIYGAAAGAGSMYAGSEASLQQPPMAHNDGHWAQSGGYDAGAYPPQRPYSPGGFAPPHSASQQYLVPRSGSPFGQQQPYTPTSGGYPDGYLRSPSPYGQHPQPGYAQQQQQQRTSGYSQYPDDQQQQYGYDQHHHPLQDPYQDPSPLEAQAMAGVGGDPSVGGALIPGGALDEAGIEMRVVRGYKATLDDELAIIPFSLIRIHQSYEDGWSLCSDPQTKQRGVVPRDCLAHPSDLNSSLDRPLSPPAQGVPSSSTSDPRTLPQIPSQSFSSSNLYDPADAHPLAPPPTFGVAMGYEDTKGRPISVVVRDEDGTEREVMRSELAAQQQGEKSGEFGGLGVATPRSRGEVNSLTPSVRSERRSSLMDSVRAAGAYLEQGGSGGHL